MLKLINLFFIVLIYTTPVALAQSPIHVTVSLGANCGISALVDDKWIVRPGQHDKALFPKSSHFQLSEDRKILSVTGTPETVIVRFIDAAGMSAVLTNQSQVKISACKERGLITFVNGSADFGSIQLKFADGAAASMATGSKAQFDYFKDQSYVFSVNGPVTAVNADGMKLDLSSGLLPLVGGPLISVTHPGGKSTMSRLTPTLMVTLTGDLDGQVQALVGEKAYLLEANKPQIISLPNGTLFELKHEVEFQKLSWQVEKGDIRFVVAEINGWKAVGLSSDAGILRWDRKSKNVDLHNTVLGRSLTVMLAGQKLLRISPGATFQAGALTSGGFSLSGSGGDVVLHQGLTPSLVNLSKGNVLVTGNGVIQTTSLNSAANPASKGATSNQNANPAINPAVLDYFENPGAGADNSNPNHHAIPQLFVRRYYPRSQFIDFSRVSQAPVSVVR